MTTLTPQEQELHDAVDNMLDVAGVSREHTPTFVKFLDDWQLGEKLSDLIDGNPAARQALEALIQAKIDTAIAHHHRRRENPPENSFLKGWKTTPGSVKQYDGFRT